MSESKTRSQKIAEDITALLRARNHLVWVISKEEGRVEQYLFDAAAKAKYNPRTWDTAAGLKTISGADVVAGGGNGGTADISAALEFIKKRSEGDSSVGTIDRGLWIMRDVPVWLEGMPGAAPSRALRNLARSLVNTPLDRTQAIILLTTKTEVPPELAGHAIVIEWPMPDRNEISKILRDAVAPFDKDDRVSIPQNGAFDAAVDAAIGLSGEEANACYAKSLVLTRSIDPAIVSKEKKQVIARERVLEWYDPLPGGLDSVGGLDLLKSWALKRRLAYSKKAREYGLPSPKGCMLVGPPGTGKSLTAKALATAFGVPLLKADLGGLKSKFVGESEANLRKMFGVVEAIGRCVLWFDEIEKALQGATSGSADGGVSADALGAILTWMQEKQGEAFVVMTSNNAAVLPPELLRRGRLDQIFFCDMPNWFERVEILRASLRTHGRSADDLALDLELLAEKTDGFTGSEIAALVPEAMFIAFDDNQREIETRDLLVVADTVVPLSKTAAEKIDKLREWARGRAAPASSPVAERPAREAQDLRMLEIG